MSETKHCIFLNDVFDCIENDNQLVWKRGILYPIKYDDIARNIYMLESIDGVEYGIDKNLKDETFFIV